MSGTRQIVVVVLGRQFNNEVLRNCHAAGTASRSARSSSGTLPAARCSGQPPGLPLASLRHIHVLTAIVACAPVAIGRFSAPMPLPPGLQNEIVVGLLLLMFALVPNHASRPPAAWHATERQRALLEE